MLPLRLPASSSKQSTEEDKQKPNTFLLGWNYWQSFHQTMKFDFGKVRKYLDIVNLDMVKTYICMCVCVHVCILLYIHIYVHFYIIYIYMYVYISLYIVCIHIYVYVYI
jgi:hypothetical protein